MKDFVMLSRQIGRDFVDGKLSINERSILIWIIECANAYDGRYLASHRDLCEIFRESIKPDNMRKIINSLRRRRYIWFANHRGRGGKFAIYPCNYQLSNRYIQQYDDFISRTNKATLQPDVIHGHKLGSANHNLTSKEMSINIDKDSSIEGHQITGSNTNTDKDNENKINRKNGLEELGKTMKKLKLGH